MNKQCEQEGFALIAVSAASLLMPKVSKTALYKAKKNQLVDVAANGKLIVNKKFVKLAIKLNQKAMKAKGGSRRFPRADMSRQHDGNDKDIEKMSSIVADQEGIIKRLEGEVAKLDRKLYDLGSIEEDNVEYEPEKKTSKPRRRFGCLWRIKL